ncbi:tubulin epsilon and delta complex protein 1 isoform X2 [Mirounga angustirostris]|uniref:tubulin epsilon and delta complex protein 1 isoform X2 n=1 Tax=Mirounga leonina TaxID=9715 RepID=UPI00156C2A6D|nr:tubulin epsilon and delta complex protein 1 isoform X2 [Mirounga leonina]XP_045757627.1 tubulin epsilon and delta complex protein 1 isoform X2 [Mirounga angustirostris]
MGRRRPRGPRGDAVGALPEAIAALSQTLPAGPSPEIFRRAKFDRPEAAPALWQLLFRVLSPLPRDGASDSPASPASPALEAQVHLVKSALRSQGYPRRALAQLPEDGSQGSRELLLALAWLLARGPLLEQLLAQTRVRLGDEIPLCECEALASAGPLPPRREADGPVDIRHLQWLMGKLRFQWRNLITSQQEQCALLGKIHSYTQGCHSDRSLGHLSVAETELFRDPEGGRQDTVLGACPLEASQPTFLPRIPTGGAGELELVAQELQALHEELRGAAEPRRAAWEARAGGWGPEQTAVQRASREAVGQELAALQRACEQGEALAQPHGPCRLVKRDARASGGPGLRAAELIGALRSRETCLEAVLGRLQTRCRQELTRLAGARPGLLWILPPGH